jgi:hypothetical protein
MTRMITAALGLGILLALPLASPLSAHHAPSVLGTVRLSQPVMAGGTMLQPGTYEVRLTGEHVLPLPGQSEDAVQAVEFVANGAVVARDAAEVVTAADGVAVGTSGGTISRPRVELLKGGDFMRVSMSRGGERYLIHLPVAH